MIVSTMKSSAEARLEVAKAKSEALQKEAATESENSENIQPMRSHEARMEMSDVLEKMAKDGKFVVSGKTGQQVLDSFTGVIKTIDANLDDEEDDE